MSSTPAPVGVRNLKHRTVDIETGIVHQDLWDPVLGPYEFGDFVRVRHIRLYDRQPLLHLLQSKIRRLFVTAIRGDHPESHPSQTVTENETNSLGSAGNDGKLVR